jgi:hypothetical protein
MDWDWLIRIAAMLLALGGVAVMLRSLWRDLQRPRGRENPQSDLEVLDHLAIGLGAGISVAVALGFALTRPGVAMFVAIPLLAVVPLLLGVGAAFTIRFVPATHPAWRRLIRRLKATD